MLKKKCLKKMLNFFFHFFLVKMNPEQTPEPSQTSTTEANPGTSQQSFPEATPEAKPTMPHLCCPACKRGPFFKPSNLNTHILAKQKKEKANGIHMGLVVDSKKGRPRKINAVIMTAPKTEGK